MCNKRILMMVNTPIQYDARVQRAANALKEFGVTVLSMNSDKAYSNSDFESKVFVNTFFKGFILNVLFEIYLLFYCLKNRRKYALFYVHDFPIVFTGWIAALLCGKKWVYDAHELLLQRKTSKIPFKRRIFIFLERIAMGHADLVVAANYERERIVRNVYHLVNTIHINNVANIQIESGNSKKRKEYIVYQGCVSKERDLRPFIGALAKMDKSVTMRIVGGGDGLNYFKQYTHERNLEAKVVFTGRLPYDKLLNESLEGKIGILVYPMEGLNNLYCSPNKIYEYAQAGLPMLVSPQPFLKYMINKYHIGEILEYPFNEDDIAFKANKILSNYESYSFGLKSFCESYSFDNECDRLNCAIRRIV